MRYTEVFLRIENRNLSRFYLTFFLCHFSAQFLAISNSKRYKITALGPFTCLFWRSDIILLDMINLRECESERNHAVSSFSVSIVYVY